MWFKPFTKEKVLSLKKLLNSDANGRPVFAYYSINLVRQLPQLTIQSTLNTHTKPGRNNNNYALITTPLFCIKNFCARINKEEEEEKADAYPRESLIFQTGDKTVGIQQQLKAWN